MLCWRVHQTLQLHPDSRCDALTAIDAEIRRMHAGLWVRFTARGKIADILRSPAVLSRRAEELWKSTCFEAFLRARPDYPYYEFNFSPSREWAVYRFAQYREGRTCPDDIVPQQEWTDSDAQLQLQANLDFQEAADMPSDKEWLIGLSAVIEETNGRKSYWALRHPAGKPDFHHPDCFALELPPPSAG